MTRRGRRPPAIRRCRFRTILAKRSPSPVHVHVHVHVRSFASIVSILGPSLMIETHCASACGTSGCRNDGRACATSSGAYRCTSQPVVLHGDAPSTHKEGVPCIKTGARPGQKDLPSATCPLWARFEDQTSYTDLTLRSLATQTPSRRRCRRSTYHF